MKGAIIANKVIDEVTSLVQGLDCRGIATDVLSYPVSNINDINQDYVVDQLSKYDFLYYRNGLGDALRNIYGEILQGSSIKIFNQVILEEPLISNKIYQTYHAAKLRLPIPKTLITKTHSFELVANSLACPFISKQAEGIKGEKVWLINNEKEFAERTINRAQDVICQQFIPNEGDYRVFVIGGKVHEIFMRKPSAGSFKANIASGGVGERVTDDELRGRLSQTALGVAAALRLEIAGIDLIKSTENDEIYFIEANVNPGWKGLDAALGIDTGDAVAEYFHQALN